MASTATPEPPLGTAQQHALAHLRRLIVSGDLAPGKRVNQEELAARIGVSVGPVREALQALEQEGQLTYLPRRGYFVTELKLADLQEIYALRELLEERAARHALPTLDDDARERIRAAARECEQAAKAGDVQAELAANRRFHFAILEAPDQPHALRLIKLLWDSTEAYRALYYNSPAERERSLHAHDRILAAIDATDADELIVELNAHRHRALDVLRGVLG